MNFARIVPDTLKPNREPASATTVASDGNYWTGTPHPQLRSSGVASSFPVEKAYGEYNSTLLKESWRRAHQESTSDIEKAPLVPYKQFLTSIAYRDLALKGAP